MSETPSIPAKVTVLGAGPTNLASALVLSRNGVAVEIFEKAPEVGGMSGTFEHGKYRLDFGPHRFTPHTEEVHDTIKGILGERLQVVSQRVQIHLFGRLLDYPFRPFNLLVRISPLEVGRILWSLLTKGLGGDRSSTRTSYRQWVTSRFGKRLAERVFCSIAEKTWGTSADDLAASLAEHRIAIGGVGEIVRELATGKRKSVFDSPFYPANSFLYPSGGYGSICRAMADEIIARGGVVHTGTEVVSIGIERGRVEKIRFRSGVAEEVTGCEYCVSTLPLSDIVERIEPRIEDPVVRGALSRLRVRSLILFYLVLRRERLSRNHTIFFPSNEFSFSRTFEQKNFDPSMIPANRTVFGVEIACWKDDRTWISTDDEIFAKVAGELERAGLISRDEVEEYFSRRLSGVYPVVDLEFAQNLGVVREALDAIDNLIINGRPGLLVYNNLHHAVEMGLIAGRQILSGEPRRERWHEDRKIFDDYRIVE